MTEVEPAIERVVLTGFMGAGKTTVGRLLASTLGWSFLDTDDLVSKTHRASPAEIFATHGERFFRQAELFALASALAQSHCVIGLGGGLLEMDDALASITLSPATLLVFLQASLKTLRTRCQGDAHGPVRPLLAHSEGFAERYKQRLPRYQKAHLTVTTEGLAPMEVAHRIQAYLQQPYSGTRPENDPTR